jgi:DNA-directed RNA polymerase II subunit RPB1
MALQTIILKLRQVYPDSYIVYTPENASHIIIRLYFKNVMFKGIISLQTMIDFAQELKATIIRGIDGIISANAVKLMRSFIDDDGSIKKRDTWGIKTTGTNISNILDYPGIDKYSVLTDAIQEMYSIYGIEAARLAIIQSMKKMGTPISSKHYGTYADTMCSTGKITSIEPTGLKNREPNNVLLRCGGGPTRAVLEDAANECKTSVISGVSAPLMVGQSPKIGTNFNTYYMNEELISKYVKKTEDLLAALY